MFVTSSVSSFDHDHSDHETRLAGQAFKANRTDMLMIDRSFRRGVTLIAETVCSWQS